MPLTARQNGKDDQANVNDDYGAVERAQQQRRSATAARNPRTQHRLVPLKIGQLLINRSELAGCFAHLRTSGTSQREVTGPGSLTNVMTVEHWSFRRAAGALSAGQ